MLRIALAGQARLTRLGLAALALLLLACLVPTSAHARWLTAAGTPPIYQAPQVCANGMTFRFADISRPDRGDSFTLPDVVVTSPPHTERFDPSGNPTPAPPESVVFRGSILVPRNPIYVPVEDVGGTSENFPTLYEYSGIYTYEFSRRVAPTDDARIGIDWGAAWTFPVRDCHLIDLDPGVFPNRVNPRVPDGRVTVAVLTTPTFNATSVRRATARLRGGTAEGPGYTAGTVVSMADGDFDGDGDRDRLLTFNARAAGIGCATTTVTLDARTNSRAITGTDEVETPPCTR